MLDLPVSNFQDTTGVFEDVSKFLVPSGAIVQWQGADSPNGWLPMGGNLASRTFPRPDYPALSRIFPGAGDLVLPHNNGCIVKV